MSGALRTNARWLVVGGLIIVNIALITALFVRQSARAELAVPAHELLAASTAPASATPTSGDTPSPTMSASHSSITPSPSSPSPSPPSTSTAAGGTQRAIRLITANSAKIAWRAHRGSCGEQAKIEAATAAGRIWRQIELGPVPVAERSNAGCADQLGAVAIAGHGAATWRWIEDEVSVR